jgi:hypothetical protein
MAKSIAYAQSKWERKTAAAGTKWKAAVTGKGASYSAGIQDFLGQAPAGAVVTAWEQGVGAVSADEFQRAIAGKGGKYAENLRRGLTMG